MLSAWPKRALRSESKLKKKKAEPSKSQPSLSWVSTSAKTLESLQTPDPMHPKPSSLYKHLSPQPHVTKSPSPHLHRPLQYRRQPAPHQQANLWKRHLHLDLHLLNTPNPYIYWSFHPKRSQSHRVLNLYWIGIEVDDEGFKNPRGKDHKKRPKRDFGSFTFKKSEKAGEEKQEKPIQKTLMECNPQNDYLAELVPSHHISYRYERIGGGLFDQIKTWFPTDIRRILHLRPFLREGTKVVL